MRCIYLILYFNPNIALTQNAHGFCYGGNWEVSQSEVDGHRVASFSQFAIAVVSAFMFMDNRVNNDKSFPFPDVSNTYFNLGS